MFDRVLDVLASLDDLADALRRVGTDLDACDADVLAGSIRRLATLQTTFQALWLHAIGLAEERSLHRQDGARDVATWLAELAGERRGASRRDVELAGRLAESPLVAEAMSTGEVSKAKATELVRAADLPEDTQQALLEEAHSLPVEQLAAAVERARLVHGVSSPPVAPAITITRRTDHAVVEATLDLVDAELLDVALSTAVETLDLPATMPYPQRRARALGAVARFFLDHQRTVTTGRTGRPHVVVLVDLEVLEARSGGSATLSSGAVISGDQARRLAEDANISRVITKGRSEPLDVGRSTRSIPPAIAKAVIARDRHCKYESCTSPVWACDIHHLRPWASGGSTALPNLGLLCWHHHELVHRHGAASLHATAEGRWTLTPAGASTARAA
jgi:Domain of unknown function (DUF222)